MVKLLTKGNMIGNDVDFFLGVEQLKLVNNR